MATRDDETLIRLRKALESRSTTDYVKEAWQERLSAKVGVAGSSLMAGDIVSGMAGSWAGSLSQSPQATRQPDSSNSDKSGSIATDFAHEPRKTESRLGRRGPPEVNFRPYDWGTNRFGTKGPALLGHPISFSIVGPTMISPFCDWQWDIAEGASNDTLTMANGPLRPRTVADLAEGYNLSGSISDYNGGLYVVITDRGEVDGSLRSGNPLVPLAKHEGTSQFEIFRVLSFTGEVLTLAGEKRLSAVFTVPGSPACRSIMLLQPHVTRLVGIPGSGPAVGRERIFVVVPPETAASSGWFPPKKVWDDGGFEPTGTAGEAVTYGGQVALPVPTVLRSMAGIIETGAGGSPADGPGLMRITGIAGSPVISSDEGKVVQVTSVNLLDGAALKHGDVKALLGWYEVHENIGTAGYVLKRLPEVDPKTGQFYFGPGPYFDTTGHTGTAAIQVSFTLHNNISSLYAGEFSFDAVEAARLVNLIDPEATKRSVKTDLSNNVPVGGSGDRADKAIFNTESGSGLSNPGSLLDLGFRMVFYPAKDVAGVAVPDFTRPITSHNTVIDPAVTTEPQFIEVDYANGMVYLSHAPPASSGGTIIPNGIVGTSGNNTRAEVVLFAACVPYSREGGQTGVSMRVTGGDLGAADLGYSESVQADIFGGRVLADLLAHAAGSNPHRMTVTGTNSNLWPPTGMAEVLFGSGSAYGLPQGTISYAGIGNVQATTFDLLGVATDASIPFTVPATVVLRRSDEDIRLDTTAGSKWRTNVWRMAYADLTAQPDGSVIVMPTAVAGPAQELRGNFPLGTSTEVARLFLDTSVNRWQTTAPPWAGSKTDNEVGFEVTRGRLYASMGLDLDAADLTFRRFMNRVTTVSAINATSPDLATPPNRYELVIDTGAVGNLDQDLPSNAKGLCAVIEGSTIASAEAGTWGARTADNRFLVDLKVFDRAGQNSLVTRDYAEAPANPLNWMAFTAAGGDTPTDITAAINAHYSGLSPALVEGTGAAERVLLTGRQVRVLPGSPFLISDPIGGGTPFTAAADSGMVLTIYSADPKNGNGHKWVTVFLRYTVALTGSTDPDEVAAYLNQAIYRSGFGAHVGFVGWHLDDAGFYAHDPTVTVSPNPWLSGTAAGAITAPTAAPGVGERQILFIGPSDPRHPGGQTVALICGGWGSSESTGATRDFYNVMVEVGKVNPSPGTKDIASQLGGAFDPSPYSTPTCGLFFGDDANDIPGSPPSTGDFASGVVRSKIAEVLGFSSGGVPPLGHLVGSHLITGTDVSPVRATIDMMKGHGEDWYAGPQRTSTLEQFENPDISIPALRDRINEYGYLGRWMWGSSDLAIINRGSATAAGLADIWISYGLQAHGESGFTSQLTQSSLVGYDSFLARFSVVGTALDAPGVASDGIAAGDLLIGTQDGSSNAVEGRVLSWDGDTKAGEVMLVSRGNASSTHGHVIATGTQPSSFGAFNPTLNPVASPFSVSVIPRPGFGSFQSAFRSLVGNANGLVTDAATDYGQGLDGGSTNQTASPAAFSGVSVGAGRVDLMSLVGPSALPGLSFTNPVVGEGTPISPLLLTTTFLESGVFTTSVTLGDGRSAPLDSAGIWDQHDENNDGSVPPVKGLGRGLFEGGYHVGGVGGLRISGDAQVWLTNLRPLKSVVPSAFVRQHNDLTGAAHQDNLMKLGPAAQMGMELGSAHTPAGFGAARRRGTGESSLFIQEATVSLGLTRADIRAFMVATGKDTFPAAADSVVGTALHSTASHRMAAMAHLPDIPVLMPFLAGSYLKLEDTAGVGASSYNDGVWRVVGTPVITTSALSDQLLSQFPALMGMGSGTAGSNTAISLLESGGLPSSAMVAVIQVRVERFCMPPATATGSDPAESFIGEDTNDSATAVGHAWSFWADVNGLEQLYVADVVDPGGSPTGAPRSLHGLNLDPSSMGRNSLHMEMIPVFTTGPGSSRWAAPGPAKLLGIRESEDNRGRVTSHAWFSWAGTPGAYKTNAYARAVIRSSARWDGLDDMSLATTQGEFAIDRAGRVSFVGHVPRLGAGVLIDGGLGLVMATAFRATPKPTDTDILGSLAVVGRNAAWPLTGYGRSRSQTATSLPSAFNASEFYEDVTIVGPGSTLQFEDSRAAQGLVYRLKENAIAANAFAGPARRLMARTAEATGRTADYTNVNLNPSDTLFPAPWSGIRFRSPGTVRYERPFRTIDARGGNPSMQALQGAKSSGIRGIETPQYGECLLLPKGPPTEQGTGTADFVTDDAVGLTPLDRPLYEFFGSKGSVLGEDFAISPEYLFSSAERTKDGAVDIGPAGHQGAPGILSQAYRHSRSRENITDYPVEATAEQMRILDGMIIEDVTNGTFYTAGAVGRDNDFTGISTGTTQIGDAVRGPSNGSLTVAHGGTSGEVELLYDLHPYVDVAVDPTTHSTAGLSNGFGDRIDTVTVRNTTGSDGVVEQVRRPLVGHQYRITPNVEFVPVLGHRSVQGGLIPPYTDPTDDSTQIPGADAIFYDLGYDFKSAGGGYGAGDVGRIIYICGTYEYKLTGWWVVIDVLDAYPVQPNGTNEYSTDVEVTQSVAVVRKMNRTADVAGNAEHYRDSLPLRNRAPLLTASGDHLTNAALMNGGVGDFGQMSMVITAGDGLALYTLAATTLTPASPTLTDVAAHLNATAAFNGLSTSLATQFIIWKTNGAHLEVTYDLTTLSKANVAKVVGHKAMLRVEWLSTNTGHVMPAAGSVRDPRSIGFHTYPGSSSQLDRGAGDRNNAAPMVDISEHLAYSAAAGLRWLFSAPLLEEHTGSYLHLTKPAIYRFNTLLATQAAADGGWIPKTSWISGHPASTDQIDPQVNIFRINRCPTTANMVVGGDCEEYYTEIIRVGARTGGSTPETGKGRPVLYSPLSLYGFWPDTMTGEIPQRAHNYELAYALQPIARERIVAISPNNMASNEWVTQVHPTGGAPSTNEEGTGGPTAVDPHSGLGFDLTRPWRLMDRAAVAGRSGALAWNADSLKEYVWAPAGQWWQLFVPAPGMGVRSYEEPLPTLRVDLTEAFTQAMQPGSGINSPYPNKQPKGARLTRIWVNCGLWGNTPDSAYTEATTPGYRDVAQTPEDVAYMAFNLIVELPGSDAREFDGSTDFPWASGPGISPFGGRAPTATYNHATTSAGHKSGGTVVVPLYCNREAGDLMPNVMERFVTAGPTAAGVTQKDWVDGDAEHGFGCSQAAGAYAAGTSGLHKAAAFAGNSFNPILWGGMDFKAAWIATRDGSRVQATPLPRSSVVSGGLRSPFTSGMASDLTKFSTPATTSLSPQAMTGVVLTHHAAVPGPPARAAGSNGTNAPITCPHAFTIALTPVGDSFDETDTTSNRLYGRTLESGSAQPGERQFKVGNWLDKILETYGHTAPSGSMLPPGARVFLEITVPYGDPAGLASTMAGSWVGRISAAFEVETADGTAYVENVNHLGND